MPVKSLLRKLRKINQSRNRVRAQANIGLRRFLSGSCNGMFSAGFPTGVRGYLPRLALRTGFFDPSRGGHVSVTLSGHFRSSTALKQLSESITACSHLQARVRFFLDHSENRLLPLHPIFCTACYCLPASVPVCRARSRLQLSENSNGAGGMQELFC